MAGTSRARSTRGRYSAAGYVHTQPMYIADVPAGSRQDDLRDLNRKGYAYRSERPWHDTPEPALEGGTAAPAQPAAARHAPRRSAVDRLMLRIRRERRDFAVCAVLLAAILTLATLSGQKAIEGVHLQRDIARYQESTAVFDRENERLEQQLELAKGGERIRNLAQNRLNMLRPERAQTETIYVQTTDNSQKGTLQQNEEPRMELLDILLGLLNVLNIGE